MRILIVEDDPLQLRLLNKSLSQAGHEVEAFQDGRSAWACIQQDPPRVVITDWMMPNMDGTDLIRHIRAAGLPYYTYTILLTSRDKQADVLEGLASGADDFKTKPFDPQEMVARVAISERVISLEDRLRASQERLQVLASHDGLTGLFNRQAILDHAAAEVNRSRRMDVPVSVVLLDVDHFKQINDVYGHLQGDLVLCTIGEALA